MKKQKRPFFTLPNLIVSVFCLLVFLTIGLAGYYQAAGEFAPAQTAGMYAILSLVGALAVLLRLLRFALFYYTGCALGWAAGWFIAGLKGDFAPTAGMICTVFLIVVFSLFGIISQFQSAKKHWQQRSEERRQKKQEETLFVQPSASADPAQPDPEAVAVSDSREPPVS